ncbi:MAG: radical SAM protein [Clostridia bacterium]
MGINIGLLDIDSKLPNLALMKISSYYKSLGVPVEFVQPDRKEKYSKIYASSIFSKNLPACQDLVQEYGDRIEIGGSGFDLHKKLPSEIESMQPDYSLYSSELLYPRIKGIMKRETRMNKAITIVNAGIGFSSRGCVRKCPFCLVWQKEGSFHQASEIKDLLSPKSNVLILNDNNLTADPFCVDKLQEIRDRNLVLDINQGIDIRLVSDDIGIALSQVRHLRSIHYSWDLMCFENQVLQGIKLLSKYIKPYRHMVFLLVGFNTSFEEDMYRVNILREMGVKPYIMVMDDNVQFDVRLAHFERWVNSSIYKIKSFEEYHPWLRAQRNMDLERLKLQQRFIKQQLRFKPQRMKQLCFAY